MAIYRRHSLPADSVRILIVDPDASAVQKMVRSLDRYDFLLQIVGNGAEAVDRVSDEPFDAVVAEYHQPDLGGAELVLALQKRCPRLPIVVITEDSGSGAAIESIKAGAYDFLPKPVDGEELGKVLSDAIEVSRRMSKTVEIGVDGNSDSDGAADAMVGRSRPMMRVYRELGLLSATPVTVLIRGETGTGKELIARALYQHGHRAHKPFITVNCAAIPENLLESELFGHERGAFTGAVATRIGKFEQARDATLFLDEIGDLDPALQSKLLRVLQERRFQRVGGRDDIAVDVRVIAATHRDLKRMVEEGSFREDLFYRLNVASIDLPPLRERREDIGLLTDYFLRRYGREAGVPQSAITKRAQRYLEEQPWPGNVRQLQNVLRRALVLRRGYAIDRSDLEDIIRDAERPPTGVGGAALSLGQHVQQVLEQAREGRVESAYEAMRERVDRELLGEAIRMTKGNQARAARWLGISRLTLREKLKRLGLHPKAS
jgi:DNA-binding NtrC family response regulator